MQTRSLAASGWASQVRIQATTTPSKGAAARSMASTSKPAMVRRSASTLESQPLSTHSLSQSVLILIRSTPVELTQEIEVALEEQAQVVDRIAQHGHAVDTHAEGITLPATVIYSGSRQHVRVNHAAAEHL